MGKPFVTIMMSVFNEEKYVADAIQSILNQTYQDFELIIINDYSTDGSLEICKLFNDSRIRIYSKTNEPRNLASSRIIAIGMAQGEYITTQDADDTCDSHRIEKQLRKALENPGNRVVGCQVRRVVNKTESIMMVPERHEDIIKGFERLFNRTTIVGGTILAPTKIMREYPYRIRFSNMEDWDQLLRIYESGKVEFYNCQEPLYTYFIRKKGSLFRSDFLIQNIYLRHSQKMRRLGKTEFDTEAAFCKHLDRHPIEKIKWLGLKKLIEIKLRMRARPI